MHIYKKNKMEYQKTVDKLLAIEWGKLTTESELTSLMYISLVSAIEFAKSLRIALVLHNNNPRLIQMAAEELETDNLTFGDYNQKGDHYQFLFYFLKKAGHLKAYYATDVCEDDYVKNIPKRVVLHAGVYQERIDSMYHRDRTMSIFSREKELPKIFSNMLNKIELFKEKNLPEHLLAFKYYLERHIVLDSAPGGHSDLVNEFEITDRVNIFYERRLDLYKDTFRQLQIL